MGIAALVLGIVSLVISFIPFCGTWAVIPAVVGLVLGIIDWVKKGKAKEPKGKAVAGTICSGLAVIVIIIWWILAGIATTKVINEASDVVSNYDWNSVDWDYTIED